AALVNEIAGLFDEQCHARLTLGDEFLQHGVEVREIVLIECGKLAHGAENYLRTPSLRNLWRSMRVIMFSVSNRPSQRLAHASKVGTCTSRLLRRKSR